MSWTLESYVTDGANPRVLSRGGRVAQYETVMFRLVLRDEGEYVASDPANWAEPPLLRVSGDDGYGGTTSVDVRAADENILTFYYTFNYTGTKTLLFWGTPGEHTEYVVIDWIDNFAELNLTRVVEVTGMTRGAGSEPTPRATTSASGGAAATSSPRGTGTGARGTEARGTSGRGVAGPSTGVASDALTSAGTDAAEAAIDAALDATFRGSGTDAPPSFAPITDPATRAAIVRREQFFAELGPHVSEGVRAAAASPDFSERVATLDGMRVEFEAFMQSTTRALDDSGGYRDSSAPRTERALTSAERTRGRELIRNAHDYSGRLYNDARPEMWRQIYAGEGRAMLLQARADGIVQFTADDEAAGRAPRVSVNRSGRAPTWEAINLDHATPRERNPFAAMEPANLRPTSSTYNQAYLNRWSATSAFPMYDSPIEDFVARHRLTNRMHSADESSARARRRLAAETEGEDVHGATVGSVAAGVAEIVTRAAALYRLHEYHQVAERIRADLETMRAHSEEVGDIHTLTHATLYPRAQDVFGPPPQECDVSLISRYERAFGAWFDMSYAGAPGGRGEEYDSVIASRNTADMSYVLSRTVEERTTLRSMLPWIQDRLTNRAQLLDAAEGFRQLAELIGDVTSEEVNDLAIQFDDWWTLLHNAERLSRTLHLYVRVLDEMLERLNEGLMVIEQRYRALDGALSEVYAASGGYVD